MFATVEGKLMILPIALTQRALEQLLADDQHGAFLAQTVAPPDLSSPYQVQKTANAVILRGGAESSSAPCILLTRLAVDELANLTPVQMKTALERCRTAFNNLQSPPWHLPMEWAEYHDASRVAFFMLPRQRNPRSLRCVAEALNEGEWKDSLVFWTITARHGEVSLRDHQPSEENRQDILALAAAREMQPAAVGRRRTPTPISLIPTVQLSEITPANQNTWANYSQWTKPGLLTMDQRRFLDSEIDGPYTITGIAGTGKTLLLMLKALQVARRDLDVRVAIVTHSWFLASKIDESLRILDETDAAQRVDVLPFFALAQQHVGEELQRNHIRLIGEDSLSGKLGFYDIVSATAEAELPGLTAALKGISQQLRDRAESKDPSVLNGLAWDLTIEFATVFLANNIVPSPANRKRYLDLERMAWMMPMHSHVDRELVYRLFEQFHGTLRSKQEATSGHLSALFSEYVNGFVWDYVRPSQGYDLVLVDEYHFFDAVERQCLAFLTRDATAAYPKVVRAIDPRQGPLAIFQDVPMRGVTTTIQGRTIGGQIDLSQAHRFGPEVLAFVRHVLQAFPTLELQEGAVSVAYAQGASMKARTPVVAFVDGEADLATAVLTQVARLQQLAASGRIAVVSVGGEDVARLSSVLEAASVKTLEVSTRDKLDRLSYDSRSIPVVSAGDVAGLQFDAVVVVLSDDDVYKGMEDYRRRRLLSLFYVAITRARQELAIVVRGSQAIDATVTMLKQAVDLGILCATP
jgi:hypothetical protein